MTTLCATPYDSTAPFFYFDSTAEFQDKYNASLPVEEYEIQYIDGDNSRLFAEADVNQSNIHEWFDNLADIDDDSDEGLGISYLLSIGYTLSDALERADEVQIYRGRIEDYVFDFFNDTNEIPEHLAGYIDYQKVRQDMEIENEFIELSFEIYVTNPSDF